MKIKLFIAGLLVLACFHFSCSDDLNSVGNTIRPDEDGINVRTDSFDVQVSTIKVDSIYAKTTNAGLGQLYDPLYGDLKSDYITQFYCEEDFRFEHEPIDGKIDSVKFLVIYSKSGGWVGDSLAVLEAQLYMVDKPLERDYYSNFDPIEYVDMNNSLGKQTYAARDMTYTNEQWFSKNSYGNYVYPSQVSINMPREFGQKIYDETINNPETFKNQQSFNEFIPGIYVTTTYGSGSILNVSVSGISVYYSYTDTTTASNGTDSTYVAVGIESFISTKEVIQLNRFDNSRLEQLLDPADEYAYLKSPGGVFTKLTLPTVEMLDVLEDRTINNIPFNFKVRPQEEWEFAFDAPFELALIPADSMKVFFQESRTLDDIVTFYSMYQGTNDRNPIPLTYNFGNIATVIQEHLKNSPEKDLELILIPVSTNPSYNGTTYTYTRGTSTTNEFTPAGAKISKDVLNQIKVTSNTFAGK